MHDMSSHGMQGGVIRGRNVLLGYEAERALASYMQMLVPFHRADASI